MDISSRTPEGVPNQCPVCGKGLTIEPSQPAGDAPCPHCGHLLWFTQEEIDDATVVRFLPKEELQAADIERVAVQFLRQGEGPRLVLDLTGFNSISSGALAMLIGLHKRVKSAAGSLKLRSLSPKMREFFTLTRLDGLFGVSDQIMPCSEPKRRWYQFTLRALPLAVVLALSVFTTVLAIPRPYSAALLVGMAACYLFAWAVVGMYRGTCTDNLATWSRQDTPIRFWLSIMGAIMTGIVLAVFSVNTFLFR